MELTEYLYQKRVVNGYKFKLDEKKAIMSLLTPFKIVPCDQGALHKKKKKAMISQTLKPVLAEN